MEKGRSKDRLSAPPLGRDMMRRQDQGLCPLPVVDRPFGHHLPCNGFCGEGQLRQQPLLTAYRRCRAVSGSPRRCASACWPRQPRPCCDGFGLQMRQPTPQSVAFPVKMQETGSRPMDDQTAHISVSALSDPKKGLLYSR